MKKIINKIIIILIMLTLTYQGKIVYARDETMVEVPEWLQDDILKGILMPEGNFTKYYKNNQTILKKCNEIDKKIRDNYGANPYSEGTIIGSKINTLLNCGVTKDGDGNTVYGSGKVPKWLLDCFDDNDNAVYWVARYMSYSEDAYYNELKKSIIEDTENYIEKGTTTNPTVKNKLLYLSGDYVNGLASKVVSDVLENTDKRKKWYTNGEQWARLQELLSFYSEENIGSAATVSAAEDAKSADDVLEDSENTGFKLATATTGEDGEGTLENPITDEGAYSGLKRITPELDENVTPTINSILGAINVIGIVIAVIILVIIGIKYILGSAEAKAEYKETAKAYVLGAILIAAGPTLVNVLYQLAQSL